MNNSKINIDECKNIITHVVNTNKSLQAKGLAPVALNVVGPAGLGKTSVAEQVGSELGMKPENTVTLNLSTLDEIGDLIGIPLVEYKAIGTIKKEGEEPRKVAKWVAEGAMSTYEKLGYQFTGETQTTYSNPEWITGLSGPGILILDDYTRASQRFTQAVMQLILTQEYMGWSLPKGWTILLSSNPDDGMYNVTDQDPAQKSRSLTVYVKFDAEIWARWAEANGVDGRCINFILMNKEIVKDETPEVNPRSFTLFFNSISTITNFKKKENLKLIQLLGENSLGPEVTTNFVSFIHNRLDELITTEEILDTDVEFEVVNKRITDLVSSGASYRGDLAFVICTRLMNYAEFKLEDEGITDELIKRVEDLIVADTLGSDLKFVLSRKLVNANSKFNKLLLNSAVVETILE
jgi:hypothetical protein